MFIEAYGLRVLLIDCDFSRLILPDAYKQY